MTAFRAHGRNGLFEADVSVGALGLTLTEVPNIADWAFEAPQDELDVTCMGDEGPETVLGFKKAKLTLSGFNVTNSNVHHVLCDGERRAWRLKYDRSVPAEDDAHYVYGFMKFQINDAGGTTKALTASITGASAGLNAHVFTDTAPDPLV